MSSTQWFAPCPNKPCLDFGLIWGFKTAWLPLSLERTYQDINSHPNCLKQTVLRAEKLKCGDVLLGSNITIGPTMFVLNAVFWGLASAKVANSQLSLCRSINLFTLGILSSLGLLRSMQINSIGINQVVLFPAPERVPIIRDTTGSFIKNKKLWDHNALALLF